MPNLYQDTAEPAVPTPPLDGDIRSDVVVVGAGFTGLSTALHLAEKGAKVVVLEAEEPGYGASGRRSRNDCSIRPPASTCRSRV